MKSVLDLKEHLNISSVLSNLLDKLIPRKVNDIVIDMPVSRKLNLIILVTTIPILIILIIAIGLLRVSIHQSIDDRITSVLNGVKNAFGIFKKNTIIYTRFLAKTPIIYMGLENPQKEYQIRQLIDTLRNELDTDIIVIHDARWRVVADARDVYNFNQDHRYDPYWKVPLSMASKGIYNFLFRIKKIGENKYVPTLITTYPIFHSIKQGHLLGFVTVGYTLNNKFAYKLSNIIGANVIFEYKNHVLSTSFTSEVDLKEAIIGDSAQVNLGGIVYDRRYVKVTVPSENGGEKTILRIWLLVNNSRLWDSLTTTTILIISLSVLVILIGTGLAIRISKLLVKRLNAVATAARHITSKSFDIELEVHGNDDISDLAKAFNNMIKEIRYYSHNLEELVKQRTQELEKTNKELQLANRELKLIYNDIQKELAMARSLQEAIIPLQLPKIEGIEIGAKYIPMEEVGGDYYDVFYVPEKGMGILMADASGHGVPAALVTTMAKIAFTVHSQKGPATDEVCSSVNSELFKALGEVENYLTAFYMFYDFAKSEIYYTNAGHQKALLYKLKEGRIVELDTMGFFIGAVDDVEYESKSVKLEPGDRILLFTDGVIEARNDKGEFFGVERLMEFMLDNFDTPTDEFLDKLVNMLKSFTGPTKQDDDITVLLITAVEPVLRTTSEDFSALIKDFETGVRLMQEKQLLKAREVFEYIINKNPRNAQAKYNLGVIYFRLGEYQKAREIWEDLLKQYPKSLKLHKSLKLVDRVIRLGSI